MYIIYIDKIELKSGCSEMDRPSTKEDINHLWWELN